MGKRGPEGVIQDAILKWLRRRKDLVVVRMYLGPVIVRKGGRKISATNPNKGFPDIFGYLPGGRGRGFAIEVKAPGEKLEPHQAEWRDRLVGAGVQYVVARSTQDAVLAFASGQNLLE